MTDPQPRSTNLEGASPAEILCWTYATFERVAIVASFQVSSVVLVHMAAGLGIVPDVLTVDTGRLPQETHDAIQSAREALPMKLHVLGPEQDAVAELTKDHGPDPFLRSVELRHRCCDVRKIQPLTAALEGYDAWITGVRRDESATRRATPIVALDPAHGGIAKVAPLAGWTGDQVWSYARAHALPTHALYDQGYTSIGCAPCTRATAPGEDPRAGRWWWEQESVKECGIHFSPSGQVIRGRGGAS